MGKQAFHKSMDGNMCWPKIPLLCVNLYFRQWIYIPRISTTPRNQLHYPCRPKIHLLLKVIIVMVIIGIVCFLQSMVILAFNSNHGLLKLSSIVKHHLYLYYYSILLSYIFHILFNPSFFNIRVRTSSIVHCVNKMSFLRSIYKMKGK